MDTIQCVACGAVIPRVIRPGAGGVQPRRCAGCRRLHRQQYVKDWKAANRDRKAELDARHYRRFKERNPEYFREYYAERKERRKAESRAWYHANRAYAIERQTAYHAKRKAEQPEHVRALVLAARHRRMARERQTFVENVDPRVVFERDRGICGICKSPVDPGARWEIDHVTPVSKGGVHAYANVQLAHRACNRAKWAAVPESLCPSPSSP